MINKIKMYNQDFSIPEKFIIEMIVLYLTDRGINIQRLYFTNFIISEFDHKKYLLKNESSIETVYNTLVDNNEKIIIDVNSQYAKTYLFDNFDIDYMWKNNVKWGLVHNDYIYESNKLIVDINKLSLN